MCWLCAYRSKQFAEDEAAEARTVSVTQENASAPSAGRDACNAPDATPRPRKRAIARNAFEAPARQAGRAGTE